MSSKGVAPPHGAATLNKPTGAAPQEHIIMNA